MGSSSKTSYLKLNKWIGSDRPKREDFNEDNEKIDAEMSKKADLTEALPFTSQYISGDFNNYVIQGTYRSGSTGTEIPNSPPENYCGIAVFKFGTWIAQLAFQPSTAGFYYRVRSEATWTSWRKVSSTIV